MSKAVLEAVALEEGSNLKTLVARLGRTPGATRDYLQWLVGVDALRMEKKRYFYVDGLLRVWVRLHATGHPASDVAVRQAAGELLSTSPPDAPPPTTPPDRPVKRRDRVDGDGLAPRFSDQRPHRRVGKSRKTGPRQLSKTKPAAGPRQYDSKPPPD